MKRLRSKKTLFNQLSLVFVTFSLLMATTAKAQKYNLSTINELQQEGRNSNYVNEINKIVQHYPEADYSVTYKNGELKDVSVTGIEDETAIKHLDVEVMDLKNNKNKPERLGVFYTVDKEPSYKGGEQALNEKILNNLNYPREDLDWGVEGTVYVKFVVDENGKIPFVTTSDNLNTNIKMYKKELDQQAMNAVESTSGKWNPGQEDGVKVASLVVVPVKFEEKLNPSLIGWVE